MVHNEKLLGSNGSYEIWADGDGYAIHLYIRESDAFIFPTLNDLIRYVYFDDFNVEHISMPEDELSQIYSQRKHYYIIKELADKFKNW
jgi:hypothetical protein